MDEQHYSSGEQFYQFMRAVYNDQWDAATKIRADKTGREAQIDRSVAIGRIGICTSDIVMGAGIIYCTRNRSYTVVRGRLATARCRRRRLPPLRVVASCSGR